MQRYRFIGSYTEMGDRVFTRFGQVADWEEDVYREMVKGAPFIPDADFRRLPFTQDELDRYGDYANRALAPDSFNEKVKQAIIVMVDIREKLESRGVHEELQTVEEPDNEVVTLVEESEEVVVPAEEPPAPEHVFVSDENNVQEKPEPEDEHVVELNSKEYAVVPAPVEVQQNIEREV